MQIQKSQKRILSLLLMLLMLSTSIFQPSFAQTSVADNVQWAGSANFNAYNNQVTDVDIPSVSSQTTEKWAYALNTTSASWGAYYAGQPVIAGDYLYVTGGGKLHKVNIKTGEGTIINENAGTTGYDYDYLCYKDDVIVVASTKKLEAFSLDGTSLGSVDGTFGANHPVQYHDGYIFCNGYIYKLEKADSTVTFTQIGTATINSDTFNWNSGVFVNNLFYTVSKNTVYAVDYKTGEIKDSYIFDSERKGTLQGGCSYDEKTKKIFWGTYTYDTKLHSVKINDDGTINEESYSYCNIDQNTVCTPVIANGKIYIADQKGNIDIVKTEDFSLLGTFATGATKIQSTPIVSVSDSITKVLVQGYDGHLYVLTDKGDTQEVNKIAETRNPTTVSYPNAFEQIAIDNSGRMYCYNESGYLFCFEKAKENTITITKDLSEEEKSYNLNENAETLKIEATSKNNETLSYTWEKSSDKENWEQITSATTQEYTPITDTAGTVYYRCTVTSENEDFKTSSTAKITTKEQVTSVNVKFTLTGQDGKVAVSKDGTTEIYKTPLNVTDKDNDNKLTLKDAFLTLHELHSKNGVSDVSFSEYGVSRLWGITSWDISYVVNNVMSNGITDEISENDVISAFFYRDTQDYSYSDLYTYFENDTVSTKTSTDVEFTVKGLNVMSGVTASPKGATVAVYDSNKTNVDSLSTTVDENGKFKLNFPNTGNYTVEVSGNCSYTGSAWDYVTSGYVDKEFTSASVVPSRCFVTVTENSNSGGTTQKYVYISVKDPQGKVYLQKKAFNFKNGETAYTLLLKTGLNVKSSDTQYGKYVESIEGLGEYDEGNGSGWMCKVNGVFPNYSADKYNLSENDYIEWVYTRDLGADVGNSYGGSSSNSSSSSTVTSNGNVIKVKTTVKTANKNTSVSILDKDIKNAVKKASNSQDETTIVLSADVKNTNNISFNLSYDSVKLLSQNKNINIEISTPFGNIVISNETLLSIFSQITTDKDLKITIETENAKTVGDKKNVFTDAEKENVQNFVAVRVKIESNGKIIKEFGENSLKLYIPVSDKAFEDQKEYKVYVISDNGTTKETSGKCIYIDSVNIEVKTNHLSTFIATTTYMDESDNKTENNTHWAQKAINYVKEKGIMNGISETDFAPDENVTRAMLVTVLWRAENSPVVNYIIDFKDVKSEEWYTEAIRWATSEKIVEGYDENTFGTNDFVTREQIAAIIYRYAKYKEVEPQEKTEESDSFSDISNISDWANESVAYCKLNNIMTELENNVFAPKNISTRGEIATIIMRFFENISK